MTGTLITFEGPDGAGKSTQVARLADRLRRAGIRFVTTREPGGTPISDKIRGILLDRRHQDMTPRTEALLYAASRAQLVEEFILPHLRTGVVVLCDRYVDASLAYQGALGLDREELTRINEWATQGLEPLRTYLIDVPATVGLGRVKARQGTAGTLDRIEGRGLEYHEAVREWFLEKARQSPRYRVMDGTLSPEEVEELIWQDARILLNL